jgi:hypothetical protein
MHDIKLMTEKHASALQAISMVMWIRQHGAKHITQLVRSRATLDATRYRHRVSISTVLPRQPPWSYILDKQIQLWHCEIAVQMYPLLSPSK